MAYLNLKKHEKGTPLQNLIKYINKSPYHKSILMNHLIEKEHKKEKSLEELIKYINETNISDEYTRLIILCEY